MKATSKTYGQLTSLGKVGFNNVFMSLNKDHSNGGNVELMSEDTH